MTRSSTEKEQVRDTRVRQLLITRSAVRRAWEHLQLKGARGEEELALWTGYRIDGFGLAVTAVLPLTRSYPHFVTIDDERRVLRVWESIESQQQCLLAQLHTHAGVGWHSATDDHGCISDLSGVFSIVVPWFGHFGFRGLDGPGMAVYERQGDGGWKALEKAEIRKRLRVVEDELLIV